MQFPFCSLMCTIWPLTPYSCASVSIAQPSFFFIVFRIGFQCEKKKRPQETLVTDAQLLKALCARIRVFSFSFSARIIPSKVIIFKKIMPKTHEILNSKRKGHPNFPCPGPKIVQWVTKLCELFEATWFSN